MITALLEKWQQLTDRRTSLEKAIDWVRKYRIPGSGIVVQHKTTSVTPEVTGYLIESLYRAGEKDFAYDLAKWEASVQQKDGSFCAPDGVPYTFDTAQVVRGFLAVVDDLPYLEKNLRQACDFIMAQIDTKGEVHTPSYDTWKLPDGSRFSSYCNLYVLSPLRDAGLKLRAKEYIKAAHRGLEFYKQKEDLVQFKSQLGTLSHIFGYMMEGLMDLGEIDLVKRGMAQVLKIQKSDGSIPAYPGADWICSTGMAQLGIVWHKLGKEELAEKVFSYLERIQNASGGFYGSYGEGGAYFAGKEISWANKYFIDLYLLVRGMR